MVNRQEYFNYIEDKLSTLATRVEMRGKLNILDLNLHLEDFYRDFLNKLLSWSLRNLNEIEPNAESIDLISHSEKIVVQVSAVCSKQKVENALKSEKIKGFQGYSFKFISISKDASSLRKKVYKNPHGIKFNPVSDIYDIPCILKRVNGVQIEKYREIYDFIKKELGQDINLIKLDSNLAMVLNALSKENLGEADQSIIVDVFEIGRKIEYNKLRKAKYIIDEYAIFSSRVDGKYEQFDAGGSNVSRSVLGKIRMEYIKNLDLKADDELFFAVIDNVREIIINSRNFEEIPIDELDFCVNILVVDAFIRCKIFENPNNYKHVTA